MGSYKHWKEKQILGEMTLTNEVTQILASIRLLQFSLCDQ